MRSMTRVERFFERLVERPTARLFRTRLQPIQVLRRIERAMESGRGDGDHRNEAPDRFTVFVNPQDLASLTPLDEVAASVGLIRRQILIAGSIALGAALGSRFGTRTEQRDFFAWGNRSLYFAPTAPMAPAQQPAPPAAPPPPAPTQTPPAEPPEANT